MAGTNQTKVSISLNKNIFAAQNSTEVEVIENGKIVHRESADLKVGQVILCRDGCTFPADIALLSSSDNGDCFIKTSSLDGEKNLKKRVQPKDMGKVFPVNDLNVLPTFNKVTGHLEVEPPNKDLHTFNGVLYLDDKKKFSFSQDQLLLKGANLANTEWAIGLVSYTGEQTKIMLNSQKGRVKMSHLEGMVNQLVLYIIMAQIVICVTMAIATQVW